MLPRRIAGRYAEALFGLAQQEQKTGDWEQELSALAAVIDANAELREVLTHPEIPLAKKEGVVQRSFQGKVSDAVLAVLFMLIKRGHDPDMRAIHDIFVERWNAARRLLPVQVTTAIPLTDDQARALEQALTRRTGATIQLQKTVDPALIAGMVVAMGDRVIDASARTTLAQLRASMVGV